VKTLIIRFSVPVEVEVPDDFPITPLEIELSGEDIANDRRDGRYPHTTEDMHHAAESLAHSALHQSIEWHYTRRIEQQFGRERACQMPYELHNRLANRCIERLGRCSLVDGGAVEVAVSAYPLLPDHRYSYEAHVVVCRDDAKQDGTEGDYALATRTVFEGREAAEAYARTVAADRKPIVASIPLGDLRVGEDRGKLAYWAPP
jgi:hypothetical protein